MRQNHGKLSFPQISGQIHCVVSEPGWVDYITSLYDNRLSGAQSVTLHTNLGDLKLEIFCDEVPKTAENFLALCASGYYNDTIFHRNIRGYIQATCPVLHLPVQPAISWPAKLMLGRARAHAKQLMLKRWCRFMIQGGDPTGAQSTSTPFSTGCW